MASKSRGLAVRPGIAAAPPATPCTTQARAIMAPHFLYTVGILVDRRPEETLRPRRKRAAELIGASDTPHCAAVPRSIPQVARGGPTGVAVLS
jgi:hypothetical protein